MRVLLTGASGFVGQATLAALLRQGTSVIAISRRRPECAGRFEWAPIDLRDIDGSTTAIMKLNFDAVLHVAWNVEHGQFWNSEQNLLWTMISLNLARVARQVGVGRFIGVGTCFEYEPFADDDMLEDSYTSSPRNVYAVSKDSVRRLLEVYHNEHRISMAWARPFFMYGQGEDSRRLVPSICRSLASRQIARCSSGTAIRDFMDVHDVGEALAALTRSDVEGIVNIGSGCPVSIAEIATRLGNISGLPHLIHLGALPGREQEPERITADVSRLRNEVRYQASKTLHQGLTDAFEMWRQKAQ